MSIPSNRRPLKGTRVAETVAAELRHRILRGDYSELSLLPKQDDLAAEFGVSYPSIREALRILETENLTTVRRGKFGGSEVHRPNEGSAGYSLGLTLASQRVHVGDIAEALLILEPLAASMCAEQVNRERIILPALYKNLEETEEAIGDEASFTLFTQKARTFHQLLTDSIGNQTLRLVLRSLASLWGAQEETWIESIVKSNAYFDLNAREEVLTSHRAIVSDIERGDTERASRHVRIHLKLAQSILLDKFNDQVVDVTSIRARNAQGPTSSEGGHFAGVGL